MLSIVMPCYNEAEIVEHSVREWYDEVAARIPGSELIVVDDCSTDATAGILDRLALELPGVRHLRPMCNGGHGRALRYGFRAVAPASDFVFQTDSDLQHKPADFWKLWNKRQDFDFVFGVRSHRADGLLRILITTSMRLLNLVMWRVWIRDANCPFKLMRASALQQILARIPEDSFIPMVMVSILARKAKFRFTEVEVIHLPRSGGTQSLKGVTRWIRVTSICARQIWQLRRVGS